MTWTISHSVGLFLLMILMTSIAIAVRFVRQRHKQATVHPTHNRLQQFLAKCYLLPRHPAHNPVAAHGLSAIGLEDRNHWNAAILAQNDEAAIRGLREDYRHSNRSLNASVYERDLAHEDGTPLVHPPPAYSPIASAPGPASALSRLTAPAPRNITSSISPTTTTTTTVLPPLEHSGEDTQPPISPQMSTMPSQHFTTRIGNRYDLSSFAAGTPSLQLPINDAAEVAQRLDQLKGVFRPLVAYEELASCAVARQRRSDAATAGAGSVHHADLVPVPNPRYYRVDPPEDLEERIRAANTNTISGITILGELRGHHNSTSPSEPLARQNGVPPRIRTPGTPRPMVFGHRPVLRGPMPSQAATFAEDSEDENDQYDSIASRVPTTMNSTSTLRTDLPRVRTPGTPRPMVFGTRPVFCGRMPSQAVTVESDHEGDDSDETIRGGALIINDFDFKDEVQQSLHNGSSSYTDLDLGDEHKDETLAVDEVAEPSGHHIDVHEGSLATKGERVETNDGAKSVLSCDVSNNYEIMGPEEGYDNETGWVWVEFVPSSAKCTSTNEKHETTLTDRQTLSRNNGVSEGIARLHQSVNEDVVSDDKEVASVCCIYSADIDVKRGWTVEEQFLVRVGHDKATKAQKWKTVRNLARRKMGNEFKRLRRARRLIQMRRKQMAKTAHFHGALVAESGNEYRPFLKHEEYMTRLSQTPMVLKAAQLEGARAEWVRNEWSPLIAENDSSCLLSMGQLTFEEQRPVPFKHNKHSDNRHWQCQSSLSACNRCRAKPSNSDESCDEITLEQLDSLPRKHIWRFELHRAFQAVKEAMIHTAVDEFLEAWESEEEQVANKYVQGVSGVEMGIRGGYLSGLDGEHKDDEKGRTPISIHVQETLQAFKAITEAMAGTAQLDCQAMLRRTVYAVPADVWEKFGDEHKMRKMRPLGRLWKAREIIDASSLKAMVRVKAVLDGRARKFAQKARRSGEGLRGGILEVFDHTDVEEFSDEKVRDGHPAYAASSCWFFSGQEARHDSTSGHESGSDLSRVGSVISNETSQDTSTISSQISKDLLTEENKQELAADAYCLLTTGGLRTKALVGEADTRNRLRGIISSFRKASNKLPDGAMFPTPVICTYSLHRRLHTSMWAAAEKLWNTGDLSATLAWTKEDSADFSIKPWNGGYREPKTVREVRKMNEFATSISAPGSLEANTGYFDVWRSVSTPTCAHGKRKRKFQGIEICEHRLKAPRARCWERGIPHRSSVIAVASKAGTNEIPGSIEEVAELERMVVMHQILEPQPRAEGPKGWPMVGKEIPRIVSCVGPKRYCLLEDKEFKSKESMRKSKATKYPKMLGNWLAFVEGNDCDVMSVLSDNEDYIEIPNFAIETNITDGRYTDGGAEVEMQRAPYINAAYPGLGPRVASRKLKTIRWPWRLRSWQRYADEAVASLRGKDNAMVMQAARTSPASMSPKNPSKLKDGTKATKVKKEVIGFASGAESRLSWLGKWKFAIPLWQSTCRRHSKERLHSFREAQKIIIPTLGDEFYRKTSEKTTQLPLQPLVKAISRQDGITPASLSVPTSTSLRDGGIAQSTLVQELPYTEYPCVPSDLSETSSRGCFEEFLGPETPLPYPELSWQPPNLASASSSTTLGDYEKAFLTLKHRIPYLEMPREPSNLSPEASLRGGGNAISEVSEAAQNMAYALARPLELYELATQPGGFDPYAGDCIPGPKEIRAIQKKNRHTRVKASVLRKSRYLKSNDFRLPTPTHQDPDFVYKWEDVAWNRSNTIFVAFDRRNRYSRGVLRADMWGKEYFWDGTKMRYEHGNRKVPSQKLARRSQWTRGARRRGLAWGEELVGSLSGLRGEEFARSRTCGGDGGALSCDMESLRGGQLTNEGEKDHIESLECQEAQTADEQEEEVQSKALEGYNDTHKCQAQCSGQDAATTSASNETTKLTSNAFSHLPAPSSLSSLNQEFVPSPSPTIMSLYQASLSHRKGGVGKTMTWLELNDHHKRCRPGVCADLCRAIVALPFKPSRTKPVSGLESINAIAYWFGEEAKSLCDPSSVCLRGGFLKGDKGHGKEHGEESDWRSPNSLRDGEMDPLAHFLMRQCFSHGRVDIPAQETHADVSGHNYDCQPGSCSMFCSASGTLSAPHLKTEPRSNIGAHLAYVKKESADQTGLSNAPSVLEVHPYSQRIAELNRVLGLTVRTKFRDGYCVEGHTHPEGMDEYTESVQSRQSFRRLKGERIHLAPERQMPPLISPLPIRQRPHWWHIEFTRQIQAEEPGLPSRHAGGSLRGGDLDEAFKMPPSGVNGWLFDRSANWTFRRVGAESEGNQNLTKATDTNPHSGYEELQLPNSPPLTPVVSHEPDKLATVFEKMTFVPEQLSHSTLRNATAPFESGTISLGHRLKYRFNPYLCWPDWAYKLYDPPYSPYDSPTCDTTGRWRRPVSRHLLAGILETLPETTGMFRRLDDGTIARIGLQEMTAKERETMLQYVKGKKFLRRNSWGLYHRLEDRLIVENTDGLNELKGVKESLRGGAMDYPPSRPLALHFDGDLRWLFGCCGCRPMTPDSLVVVAVPYEGTSVYESDTDSRQSEEAIIPSPTQSPVIGEQRSKWYSRPVDATKLKDRLCGLVQAKLQSKGFKDRHGNLVGIEFPDIRNRSPKSGRLKPSEALMSNMDSHKTRTLKSKSTRASVWALRCGLRGGGRPDDEDEEIDAEMDYPSPPLSDEEEDEGYISIALLSPHRSDSEVEGEEAWENSEDDVLDEQEMDYELSVDLLPLEDAYTELRTRLWEEHLEAMDMVDQPRHFLEAEKSRPERHSKLRPAGHNTLTSTSARVGDNSESEPEKHIDYEPDLEKLAPTGNEIDTDNFTSPIIQVYDADMDDFPPLPSNCEDITDPFTDEINHSSPTYSPDVSTSASSVSSGDFPSKGMWVMVHPRVTQLLVAGTSRYKSKHLEKNSGLMRLHDDWANGTPSSMRLMTSSSAFREELKTEKAWEWRERERLDSIERLHRILKEFEKAKADVKPIADEKDGREVLIQVSSNTKNDTHAISLTADPDKGKEKEDPDFIVPIIETAWSALSIQIIGLTRPECHMVPGESKRSLEKKAKRLMTDDDHVPLKADERRRRKLERMVSVMDRAQALITTPI